MKSVVNTILFDVSKNEMFKINENYKMLHRKLKTTWKVMINREELTQNILEDVQILVVPGPQNVFTDDELACLKSVVERGDSVLVMMTDGGEERMNTNINFFLEEYGIVVNNDCVVRAKYHKFYHPKECHISNGILNRGVMKYIMKMPNYSVESDDFLSSSDLCYPVKRPIAALYTADSGGKLFVIGSGHFFADQYLECECNDLIREMVFSYLGGSIDLHLNPVDVEDPDVNEYRTLGDALFLSQVALPTPATVFAPRFREPPPPPLELFDLDEALSSERAQLARLANKCLQPESEKMAQGDSSQLESELEYFIRECGRVVRLSRALADAPSARAILHQLMVQLAAFKKIAPREE
ncbi:PREDICTED: intraflagellar transport protein 52 homolog [Papilio polytes]|uniref:intraflagellar transport protein 52 homolog n=1 Tax=Papilio polytes TaxID=76194 RepID=UPI000676AF54|nr:PREDICTED: intraflagellar transport protein 52 homolog [Papilio polytes]